jgi:hypothetical protein
MLESPERYSAGGGQGLFRLGSGGGPSGRGGGAAASRYSVLGFAVPSARRTGMLPQPPLPQRVRPAGPSRSSSGCAPSRHMARSV